MAPAIVVRDLRKSYGTKEAVSGVSFSVNVGECVGILGPNGAGKTSTLEMIEGLRQADSGSIAVLGQSPWPRNRALLSRIGVQIQATAFIEHLTAREQLTTMADLYSVPESRADELLEETGLTERASTDAGRMSGGEQQRLSIALALVHEPEVLFLDEPSTGLDPSARRDLWEIFERIRARGTTLVLTTHYMEEAEVLCDRVAIMDHGAILAMDTPVGLVRQLGAATSIVLPRGALDLTAAEALPEVTSVNQESDALTLKTREPARVLRQLADLDRLEGLQVRSAGLDDVFVSLTGREFLSENLDGEAER